MKVYLFLMMILFSLFICYPVEAAGEDSQGLQGWDGNTYELDDEGFITNGVLGFYLVNGSTKEKSRYEYTNMSGHLCVFVNTSGDSICKNNTWAVCTYNSSYDMVVLYNGASTYSSYNLDTGAAFSRQETSSSIIVDIDREPYTNLPMFHSIDDCKEYLLTGDYSKAENVDDITNSLPVEIPKPTNLKVLSGFYEGSRKSNVWAFNNPVKVTWDSNLKESEIGKEVFCEYEFSLDFYVLSESKALNKVIKTVSSDWCGYGMQAWDDEKLLSYGVTYKSDKLEAVRDSMMVSALPQYSNVIKEFAELLKLANVQSLTAFVVAGESPFDYLFANHKFRLRVRNCDMDGHHSDWVYCYLDYDDNSSKVVTGEGDNEAEEDYESDGRVDGSTSAETSNGQVIVNIENNNVNNNTNSNYLSPDDDAGSDIGSGLTSIFKFIKEGFGLLGDNGLVPMMSSIFSFIPAQVWTLVIFMIAVLIVVFFIKIIKIL